MRIPAWARPNPVLSVNGKRVSDAVDPGTFASIRRTWKDGDRVELELPMPLRLEPVDANHPELVALCRGPWCCLRWPIRSRASIRMRCCKPRPTNNATGDWSANSADGSNVTMRPFMNIDKESYSTYVMLKS